MKTKVMFITGAAQRIGKGLVEYFHQRHWNIILHYRSSSEEARAIADKLNEKRAHSVYLIQADFGAELDYKAVLDDAFSVWQRLDVLINNASSYYPTKMGEITEQQWYDLFSSNAKAPLFLSQAAQKYLEDSKGCIVNFFDASLPNINYSVYSTAKAGIAMLTKSLAKELAPSIRVNAVAPGLILWPVGENTPSNQAQQKRLANIPLKEQGSITSIANIIEYFINAHYVTGQIINVDGGAHLI